MPSMIVNFLNIDRYLKIFEFSFVKLLTSSKLNRNCFMKNEVPLNIDMVNNQRKSAGVRLEILPLLTLGTLFSLLMNDLVGE